MKNLKLITFTVLSLVSIFLAGCASQKSSVTETTPTTVAGTNDIWDASWHGDLMSVKRLVTAQPELVGATNRFGVTSLQYAAWAGHVSVVRFLLDHGANPNNTTKPALPALYLATFYSQNPQIVESLLARGADINEVRPMPPLTVAVWLGNVRMVELLLKHHPDVNARAGSTNGWTALMFAASFGRNDIARLLLANGADVKASDASGMTALHATLDAGPVLKNRFMELARLSGTIRPFTTNRFYIQRMNGTLQRAGTGTGHLDVAELLLEHGADVNAPAEYQFSPLSLAAETGNVPMADVLLSHNADIEHKDITGLSPLNIAALAGQTEMVRLLLAGGADVQTHDKEQLTPLHLAAQSGSTEAVAVLLARHAEVNARSARLQTPLHCAAVLGHADVVDLLLQNGANVRFMDVDLMTPLHHVANGPVPASNNRVHVMPKDDVAGHRAVAELLLRHGADVEAHCKFGQTPLLQAAYKGNMAVAEVLIANHADVNACAVGGGNSTPLMCAAQDGRADMVRFLIASHADVNAMDVHKRTALHLAAAAHFRVPGVVPADADFPATVNLLVANGADLNALDTEGRTPLDYAAMANQIEAARIMLEHQADINALDSQNHTPLHFAVGLSHKKMVEFLLEHHPNLNVIDNNGYTALGMARLNNENEIAQLLVSQGAK